MCLLNGPQKIEGIFLNYDYEDNVTTTREQAHNHSVNTQKHHNLINSKGKITKTIQYENMKKTGNDY